MQSLLHSNVTCHSNAKHSLRKGKHFIWLFYGHLPYLNNVLKCNLSVGKLQKNTETLFNLKDTELLSFSSREGLKPIHLLRGQLRVLQSFTLLGMLSLTVGTVTPPGLDHCQAPSCAGKQGLMDNYSFLLAFLDFFVALAFFLVQQFSSFQESSVYSCLLPTAYSLSGDSWLYFPPYYENRSTLFLRMPFLFKQN